MQIHWQILSFQIVSIGRGIENFILYHAKTVMVKYMYVLTNAHTYTCTHAHTHQHICMQDICKHVTHIHSQTYM